MNYHIFQSNPQQPIMTKDPGNPPKSQGNAPDASPPKVTAESEEPKAASSKKQPDLSSFEDTKKALFKKVWQRIPVRWRFNVAALIVIITGAVASQSFWYPPVHTFLFPPPERFVIGVKILLDKNIDSAGTEVKLVDRDKKVISNGVTDQNGYVTFSLSTDDSISYVRCNDQTGSELIFPLDLKAARKSKGFQLSLSEKRITYDEK